MLTRIPLLLSLCIALCATAGAQQSLDAMIDSNLASLVETYKTLHAAPELSHHEEKTAAFFASHDPTQVNRQGPYEGTQYRSIAFYRNEKEKAAIETAIAAINDSKKYKAKVATEVVPFSKFFAAEDYHQEYIAHNPNQGYVANVNIPDYLKFRQSFPGPYKDSLIRQ